MHRKYSHNNLIKDYISPDRRRYNGEWSRATNLALPGDDVAVGAGGQQHLGVVRPLEQRERVAQRRHAEQLRRLVDVADDEHVVVFEITVGHVIGA